MTDQSTEMPLHSDALSPDGRVTAISRSGCGAVVNVAPVRGSVGQTGCGAYVAAKHDVVGLTRSAALDCVDQSIRVNIVEPTFKSGAITW